MVVAAARQIVCLHRRSRLASKIWSACDGAAGHHFAVLRPSPRGTNPDTANAQSQNTAASTSTSESAFCASAHIWDCVQEDETMCIR